MPILTRLLFAIIAPFSVVMLLSSFAIAATPAKMTCADVLTPKEVSVDGRKVLRIDLKDGGLLSCVQNKQPVVNWIVNKDRWSDQDELNWQKFVRGIGLAREQGRCNTLDTCLMSSGNPYRDQFDERAVHFSDCADFPMYLRAYFAFKNKLPFSFGTDLRSNPPTAAQLQEINTSIEKVQQAYNTSGSLSLEQQSSLKKKLDSMIANRDKFISGTQRPQESDNGNYARGRMTVVNTAGNTRDFFSIIKAINNQISSGNYRMLLTPSGAQESDFYPTAISRQSIKTGTTIYNPDGHVGMVYDVRRDGTIMVIDAGINSDVKVYAFNSGNFPGSRPQHAAQFKNWRPQYVENARYDSAGNIVSGKMALAATEQLADFSLELYFGNKDLNNTDYKKAEWIYRGQTLDKYEYIEEKVAEPGFAYSPIDRITQSTNELCSSLQNRAQAVNTIVANNIYLKAHPSALPSNVYSTSGEWETYAINSKDVGIRNSVLQIIASAKKYLRKYQARDPRIAYTGDNLKKDMLKAFIAASAKCSVNYTSSSGRTVTLGMNVALKRVTRMSATPYFCPSRMWGANSAAELAGCQDDALKQDWYKTTQFLRNATDKDYDDFAGASLQELHSKVSAGKLNMKDRSAEFDILERLNAL